MKKEALRTCRASQTPRSATGVLKTAPFPPNGNKQSPTQINKEMHGGPGESRARSKRLYALVFNQR